MKQKFTLLLLLSMLVGTLVNGQTKKIIEPNVGFLNNLIMGDTAADGTRLSDIYVLRRDADYLLSAQIENHGWKLHIEAEAGNGKLPHIVPFPDESVTIPSRMFRLYGEGEFKNLFIDGRPQDVTLPTSAQLIRSDFEGQKLDIEGCVFANAGQAGVQVWKANEYVKVNNCQFINMGIMSQADFGNGRVFDCRDSDIGLFSLTNCTFVNVIDRIIRHRGGSGVMRNVIVDHNTMINQAAYHGFIEIGNVGPSVKITNNLMIDCMGLGGDQSDATRLSELDGHGEKDGNGSPIMVWIGSIPNDSTTYEISHNVYSVSDKLKTFYTAQGYDEGPILTEHIKGKINNAATAFIKKDITLGNHPEAMTEFYNWYVDPAGNNKQKVTTSAVDYDVKSYNYWVSDLDCSYTTEDTDFMGSDDVKVGDNNWALSTGISSYKASAVKLSAYPNPVTDHFTLSFELEKASNVSIDIFDITGKLMRSINAGTYDEGENSMTIQRDGLNSGMYLLKLNGGTNSSHKKIIVE